MNSISTEKDDRILQLIRETVRQQEPGADIILYGSRARHEARKDSDWDVIVIVDKPSMSFEEKGNIDYLLWNKGLEYGEEINTLEYTRKQWDSLPPSLFKYNVINEGIRL
ncbi:MAG: nucleotidyltransferase domain-containing protein [Prevotella sp.]|nr:nucleotidyltransferase domain-containing protein [Prevotella sp.]